MFNPLAFLCYFLIAFSNVLAQSWDGETYSIPDGTVVISYDTYDWYDSTVTQDWADSYTLPSNLDTESASDAAVSSSTTEDSSDTSSSTSTAYGGTEAASSTSTVDISSTGASPSDTYSLTQVSETTTASTELSSTNDSTETISTTTQDTALITSSDSSDSSSTISSTTSTDSSTPKSNIENTTATSRSSSSSDTTSLIIATHAPAEPTTITSTTTSTVYCNTTSWVASNTSYYSPLASTNYDSNSETTAISYQALSNASVETGPAVVTIDRDVTVTVTEWPSTTTAFNTVYETETASSSGLELIYGTSSLLTASAMPYSSAATVKTVTSTAAADANSGSWLGPKFLAVQLVVLMFV